MFGIEQRETRAQQSQTAGDTPFVDEQLQRSDPEGETKRRHGILMECLHDERDRQAEERLQAAIDEDFYDHLQWRHEDAAVLIARGQAPLVFNEARQTIDWIAGMQKRMRKDYKILPREKGDEQGAEIKSQVVKYTDDVNLTQWHRSRAFKQAALSGLGWLEEGLNNEPGEEIIYSGSEDWRNVYRDSRGKHFALKDGRYLFRRKVTDLDYAMALLPKARQHLRNIATTDETVDEDDVWFLGERLTGASDLDHIDGLPARWRDRRAYIGNDYNDRGRRDSVELLECWYRVPETVKVFNDGPLDGKVFNPADPRHLQIQRDRWAMYEAVKMRMRVMVATKDQPLWDGVSPFRHGQFLLIPIWGYRRYRDGLCYGAMRGMRDLQEDTNKRASKAQWLLANNRIVMDQGAVDDIEELRDEASRPDGVIVKNGGQSKELRFEKPVGEIQGNLEMMDRNVAAMRNVGGVTNENLGRETSARSGIAIERKQDQGSLTVSELFDNLLLATKIAGKLRLSHIEQFKTKPEVIRIVGENSPVEWLEVNKPNPDGTILNDLTEREADFIVSEQDYRESYVRAAMEEMFHLLGQIATFAPQVVLAVLDLAVEGAEIPNKDEWVARIRKISGQRDPTKAPTPEEMAQQEAEAKKAALQEEISLKTLMASLHELEAKVAKLDTETMAKRVDALRAALQAAQLAAITPEVAPVADEIAKSAGFKDQAGDAPGLPAAEPAQMQPPHPEPPPVADAGLAMQ